MTGPTVRRIGDSYFVAWEQGIIFEFHHLKDHSDGLAGELSITQDGFLCHWGRLTLASSVARAAAAKAALEAKPGQPWRKMVDASCHEVVLAARQGQPATPLEARKPEPGRWLVDGLVPVGETSILFGDGGSGKSLFALAFALCGLTGTPLGFWHVGPVKRVLYLDWEASRSDHEERLWGLAGPMEPIPEGSILYRPMVRPVAEEASELRAMVAKHQVDLVICDSLGPACGAEPETAGAATAALNALRSCAPATRLVIAHVSKSEADRQQGHSRPFGSVYVYNLARSVIEARRADTTDDREFTLTLTHTKANNGPKRPQAAIRWVWDDEGYISIAKGEPDLARAPLTAQLKAALERGSMSVHQLHEATGAAEEQIRARLNDKRNANTFQRLSVHPGGKGKEVLWGLRDSRVHPNEL